MQLPPSGALRYRPSTALADCIRARDRTCRHPGCDTAAAHCDIDHVVPYLHSDPNTGGWTIESNLHCLCRYHHTLKTFGLWTPIMLTAGIDYWTSNAGTTAVTIPGSDYGTDIGATERPSNTVMPTVARRPRGAGPFTDEPSASETATAGGAESEHDDDPAPF